MNKNTLCRRITAVLLVMIFLASLVPDSARAESFTAEVTVSKMTVRSAADAKSPVIATLAKGKQVTVLSYSNGIACISFDGQTGYALVSNLKKVSVQSSEQNSSGTINYSGSVCTVTASSAKIYASQSTSSKVVYTGKRGQNYTILSSDGTWAKIQNGSHTAYILMSNISINSHVTATPTVVPTSATFNVPEPTPTGLATVLKDNTKLYAQKSTSSKVVAKLDKGERYYHRTDAQLEQFASWRPDFEKA